MAVGPQGVLAGGGPGRVEQALLSHQHERSVGMLAAPTAASAATTSAIVPPTCTVAAPATAGSAHGTGADSA